MAYAALGLLPGALAGFSYGNGLIHSSTQNSRGLPLQSRDALGSSAIVDTTLSYDENANPLQLSDGTLGAIDSKTLAYDGLDRLSAATAIGSFGTALMEYDPLDNLRRYNLNGRDWRYVIDSSQRLSRINNPAGVAQVTLAYDARGNTIARDDQVFTFDRAQRLLDARLMSTVLQSYRYDAHGRRTASTLPNGEQRYQVYSRSGQLLYEAIKPSTSPVLTRTTDYVYLGGSLIAKRRIEDIVTVAVLFKDSFETPTLLAPESVVPVVPKTLTTTITYLHTDPLGSPVAETNTTGSVIQRTRFEPYGNPLNTQSEGQPSYTGHQYDAVTDLIYAQQRYYDPRIGRFLSVDPVGASAGSFNRYNYANNSPYRNVDPDGRESCTGSRLECSGNSASVKSFGNTSDLGPVRNPEVPSATNPDTVSEPEKEKTFLEKVADEIEDTIEEIFHRVLPALAGPEGAAAAVALKSLGLAAKGLAGTAKELNQIAHVFPRVEKGLEGLVRASGGSQLNALRGVQTAANQALAEGRLVLGANGILPGNGLGAVLNVNGVNVQLIGGRVVNGVVELGSFVGL